MLSSHCRRWSVCLPAPPPAWPAFPAWIIALAAAPARAETRFLFCFQNRTLEKVANLEIVVGISGASGSIYGLRLLERLRARPGVQSHLILTRSGERTAWLETNKKAAEIRALAHHSYPVEDIGCRLASGSFLTDAMVIAPCSIHTMSAIAHGISSNLLVRAADVALKERRKLILLVRETPFHLGHLRTMTQLAEMGAIVAPPIPGFYHQPQSVMDIVDFSVDRVLDLIGLPAADAKRWGQEKHS
ncbi:MAG: UbiX family flavin prenyltransferase [Bryobacterales bacterium]|nr:UbiX family flavin prenyltransferase [Bryobacterales bacterium]